MIFLIYDGIACMCIVPLLMYYLFICNVYSRVYMFVEICYKPIVCVTKYVVQDPNSFTYVVT